MSVDPGKAIAYRTLVAPRRSQPAPGSLPSRKVANLPGAPAPRTSASSFADLSPAPLSGRTVTVPRQTPAEIVNGRLSSLLGKSITDPALAEKCRNYFELDGENRIIGAWEDVDPDPKGPLNRLIFEIGRHIASRNDIIETSQRRNNGDSPEPRQPATEAATRALIGKSIRPEVAEKYAQAYPETYSAGGEKLKIFDGVGRVTEAICAAAPSPAEVEEMAANLTTSLTRTNSAQPRDAPRIETEIFFELALTAKKGAPSSSFYQEIKADWIKGPSHAKLTSRLQQASWIVLSGFRTEITNLKKECASLSRMKESFATRGLSNLSQYHDNVVARHFETELARALVKEPPKPVLEASAKFGACLANYARQLENKAPGLCVNIAERLKEISTPYAHHLPHLKAFLNNPSIDAFDLMMRHNETGYDILKQSLVCGQLKNAWHAMTGAYLPFAERGLRFALDGSNLARHNGASPAAGVTIVPKSLQELWMAAGKDPEVEKMAGGVRQRQDRVPLDPRTIQRIHRTGFRDSRPLKLYGRYPKITADGHQDD
jgi:hypothetical protein